MRRVYIISVILYDVFFMHTFAGYICFNNFEIMISKGVENVCY